MLFTKEIRNTNKRENATERSKARPHRGQDAAQAYNAHNQETFLKYLGLR